MSLLDLEQHPCGVAILTEGGGMVSKEKETPERLRERLRQEELKKSPGGNFNDSLNRASTGGLVWWEA
ncbi:hypothetical protein JOC95_001518 [Bacillus tianshenii]|uniref:Uncharacterized protein n=1 Tax=Sutcliffiella tianshenii TaxID=1463404 RepID=A0ABS2NYB5_9BACI|nr:hypothetical protein [Bacillus tianshenii]